MKDIWYCQPEQLSALSFLQEVLTKRFQLLNSFHGKKALDLAQVLEVFFTYLAIAKDFTEVHNHRSILNWLY